MKKCKMCNQVKSYLDFGLNKKTKDGLTYICKDCSKINNTNYKLKNKCIENYTSLAREYEELKDKYSLMRKRLNNALALIEKYENN